MTTRCPCTRSISVCRSRSTPVHRRFVQELKYGREFACRVAAAFEPDVILSSNDPLFAKWYAGRWCAHTSTPWVFWLQDIYSVAMATRPSASRSRGRALAAGFRCDQRHLLKSAAVVVPISSDFLPLLAGVGCRSRQVCRDRELGAAPGASGARPAQPVVTRARPRRHEGLSLRGHARDEAQPRAPRRSRSSLP